MYIRVCSKPIYLYILSNKAKVRDLSKIFMFLNFWKGSKNRALEKADTKNVEPARAGKRGRIYFGIGQFLLWSITEDLRSHPVWEEYGITYRGIWDFQNYDFSSWKVFHEYLYCHFHDAKTHNHIRTPNYSPICYNHHATGGVGLELKITSKGVLRL